MNDKNKSRFVLCETLPNDCQNTDVAIWWFDTERPLLDGVFVIVQVYTGLDPNRFIRCDDMSVLFTDQFEYYFVCVDCWSRFSEMQWSGSTCGGDGWNEKALENLAKHQLDKGWCEFCDPIFGNGGWS